MDGGVRVVITWRAIKTCEPREVVSKGAKRWPGMLAGVLARPLVTS